jgi:hypothetical protein
VSEIEAIKRRGEAVGRYITAYQLLDPASHPSWPSSALEDHETKVHYQCCRQSKGSGKDRCTTALTFSNLTQAFWQAGYRIAYETINSMDWHRWSGGDGSRREGGSSRRRDEVGR